MLSRIARRTPTAPGLALLSTPRTAAAAFTRAGVCKAERRSYASEQRLSSPPPLLPPSPATPVPAGNTPQTITYEEWSFIEALRKARLPPTLDEFKKYLHGRTGSVRNDSHKQTDPRQSDRSSPSTPPRTPSFLDSKSSIAKDSARPPSTVQAAERDPATVTRDEYLHPEARRNFASREERKRWQSAIMILKMKKTERGDSFGEEARIEFMKQWMANRKTASTGKEAAQEGSEPSTSAESSRAATTTATDPSSSGSKAKPAQGSNQGPNGGSQPTSIFLPGQKIEVPRSEYLDPMTRTRFNNSKQKNRWRQTGRVVAAKRRDGELADDDAQIELMKTMWAQGEAAWTAKDTRTPTTVHPASSSLASATPEAEASSTPATGSSSSAVESSGASALFTPATVDASAPASEHSSASTTSPTSSASS